MELKTVITIIAILLTFIGYIPYIRDTIRGMTKPHAYSWLIWTVVTSIAFALQVKAGAGTGSLVMLAIALMCFFIFLLSIREGKKNITQSDTACFILAFIAIILWLFIKQPALSAITSSIICIIAFIPTVRKSFDKPHSETLFMYQISAFRYGLTLLALQHYNLITWLFPSSGIITNLLFSLLLIIRRKQIKNQNLSPTHSQLNPATT